VTPTPLELAILEAYHHVFADRGFPRVEDIEVTDRQNSGAGRFVGLQSAATIMINERTCDVPFHVKMDGIENYLGFVLFLKDGRLDFLEMFTYVGSWDGEERPWRLVPSSELDDA